MDRTKRIPVPGTYNFRDPGGYPAANGRIRPGVLFRSDGLHRLGDDGREELRSLGVRSVVDLRDEFETRVMPDDLDGLDLESVQLPVFEGSGASQGAGGISLEALYERIVTQHAGVIVDAIRRIAASAGAATVVHCTAGKDRTGVVVGLSLLAVGVPRSVVLEDYARSQENLRGEWLESMVAMIGDHGVPDTPELRVLMGGSPPEALEGAIELVEREHGHVRDYLLARGLSLAEYGELERVLVDS